jgi:CIC family chloride channel protein
MDLFMDFKGLRYYVCMILLACLVGMLAAVGAMLFQALVAFSHNLFFLGQFSFIYHENSHTPPSMIGAGVILIPALGAIIVSYLIDRFAKDERGLSVPEVMYKLHHQDGKIKPSIALAKTLASIVSIGSGASIGREGPVAQIGAAISSLLSDFIHITVEQRKMLVAAGVAAGTAAIFNAPLAGAAFAIELFLDARNTLNILLMLLAASVATVIEKLTLDRHALFSVNIAYHFTTYVDLLTHLLVLILFGVILGVITVILIRGIYWTEDLFAAFFKNPYFRHVVGMFLVGVLLYLFLIYFGHYYVDGIGFSTIQDCLNGVITRPWLLFLLVVGKLFAVCLSLGTGASGGVLSPSLFIGAVLGACLGMIFYALFPAATINPVIFVVLGMAGITGGATGAIATSVLLVAELTNNLAIVLPACIVAIVAYQVRKQFCRQSIYTMKLFRRGIV